MLADSYIVPECIVRPGSLGGLMALYEANFIKLSSLVSDPARVPAELLSTSPRDLPLHLSIEEGSRYTRLFRLTYRFEEACGTEVPDPDMLVRVYLDARLAEVMAWAPFSRHPRLGVLAARYGRELDRRWSENMVLGKWLDYLLDMGHGFRTPRPA
jgi:uncharacterized protein YqiB (DUF1249 family)